MRAIINDFTIRVATVNGSGSQSSNNILIRSLFNMGIPVTGKNIFPSNIAGLPTWYSIRLSKDGYIANKCQADIFVLMNQETFEKDLADTIEGSVVLYNENLKAQSLPEGRIYYKIPFQKLVKQCCEVAKLRKLVVNMIYVGVVSQLLNIDLEQVKKALEKQFHSKPKAVDLNWKALNAGYDFAKQNLEKKDPYLVEPMDATDGKILISGNEAAALGALFAGCSVFTWYPITPASSLGESIIDYFGRFRRSSDGKANFAVVQAEDELAAIGMVIGAGWAGARAASSSSGPGISLMTEFAGLAYFTETPAVIFNVQRLGPSTGLPTRTSQGDIFSTYFMSHGDTEHLVVIPATPEECFDLTQEAFDLADEFQTLVFVLSDLDLGMNHWMSSTFSYPERPFRRGKILSEKEIEKRGQFQRYADVDGDGVPYRSLPGNEHPLASYFTRGSGHTPEAKYSEDSKNWKEVIDRLAEKFKNAAEKMPPPEISSESGAKIGIIGYGTTDAAIREGRDLLKEKGILTNYFRIRALPFNGALESFLKEHQRVYVVEQNQQAQMAGLIKMKYAHQAAKLKSVLHYDGMSIDAEGVVALIEESEA